MHRTLEILLYLMADFHQSFISGKDGKFFPTPAVPFLLSMQRI
jgi:hypothetical protein